MTLRCGLPSHAGCETQLAQSELKYSRGCSTIGILEFVRSRWLVSATWRGPTCVTRWPPWPTATQRSTSVRPPPTPSRRPRRSDLAVYENKPRQGIYTDAVFSVTQNLSG